MTNEKGINRRKIVYAMGVVRRTMEKNCTVENGMGNSQERNGSRERWSIKKEEVETDGKNQRKGLDGEGGSDARGVRGSKERRAAE